MPTPLSGAKQVAQSSPRPVTGASILALESGRAVIVKRGREPSQGLWALPGGRQEAGETLEQAARRELAEETALIACEMQMIRLIEPMRHRDDGTLISHYVLGVFLAERVSGSLRAGDDAAEARWVSRHELDQFEFVGSSREILEAYLP